jgi:hypothetical protein
VDWRHCKLVFLDFASTVHLVWYALDFSKSYTGSWALVATSVILASWGAEIRRIGVPGQSRGKKFLRPHLNGKRSEHTCHHSYSRKHKIES